MYRPFDDRYTFYTGKSKGFVAYPRGEMFSHLNKKDNLSIITCRQQSSFDFQHVFVSRLVSDMCNISSQTKETGYIFPLYVYLEKNSQENLLETTERTPNLNPEIVKEIAKGLGLIYNPNPKDIFETGKDILLKATQTTANASVPKKNHSLLNPIDLLDYIYAVLHSPNYREKYKEFLKIDFPRVPYPKDAQTFWQLVKLGSELRQIHLLESPIVEKFITQYPEDGDNVVGKPYFEKTTETLGKVYINYTKTPPTGAGELQYFANVPELAWNFHIGGYQPAQKWLKDRKGRELGFEDILHYQKIIVALTETDRIMKEIDLIAI